MKGSLQKKNDKWYAVLSYKDYTGKHRTKWVSTGYSSKNNKRKAEEKLREIIEEYERLELHPDAEMYFVDLAKLWLECIKNSVDEITLQGYKNILETQIIPYFEQRKIRLTNLNSDVFQRYINDKYEHGRLTDGSSLSPTTIKSHKRILNMIVKEGMRRDIIPKNYLEFVRMPKSKKREANFYTADQLMTLLEAIKDEQLYPLIYFTVIFGLRRSEVLGLKWDSVDFMRGTITIKHTVVTCTRVVEKDSTKNESSMRTYPLTDDVREMLIKLHDEETENRRVCGADYHDNDYIFKWPNGEMYNPDAVTRKFNKLLKEHNLPIIRFHDLRHSCASLLVAKGFGLKDIQEWLGHSDIRVTANIYAHLDNNRKQNIAKKMSEIFS